MAPTGTARKSAEVRREEILEAAVQAFAHGGLHGTSTEDIARPAGISQPYLFRLFGTKTELFLYVEGVTGARTLEIRNFFARGMLMNVAAALDLPQICGEDERWAHEL